MSGIFQGNVLGSTSLGLGASIDVPWWCWKTPNFKAHNAHCSQYSGEEHAECLNNAIRDLCPWDSPPSSGDNKELEILVTAAMDKPCRSGDVIRLVQTQTGNPQVDGKWGPQSQKYLNKSGRSFESFVTCSGPSPAGPSGSSGGSSGGSSSLVASSETAVDPAKVAGEAEKKAGFSEMFSKVPPVAWAGLAGIAALLLLKASKSKNRGM